MGKAGLPIDPFCVATVAVADQDPFSYTAPQKKQGLILPNELPPKQFAQNWARLIQKIYEVDPLVCPQCQGNMRVIAFIEDATLIQVILKHLGLWETKNHDPPPLDSFHTANELTVDESYSQILPDAHWFD